MAFNPLGLHTTYTSVYTPELLFPISRADARQLLDIKNELPFFGVDIWTAYEVSWLNDLGKPLVALAELFIPCSSEFIIESKSLKLYFNSFNQSRFSSFAQVEDTILKDLAKVCGAAVHLILTVLPVAEGDQTLMPNPLLNATCIDNLAVTIDTYHPAPELLQTKKNGVVAESLYSHLLKTNCPVTGQPDWATIFIDYLGHQIEAESLLRYIVSFREHQDFHEHCVERIFIDILRVCKPEKLSVYARYTRRGGLDINPFRTTEKYSSPPALRLLRQ